MAVRGACLVQVLTASVSGLVCWCGQSSWRRGRVPGVAGFVCPYGFAARFFHPPGEGCLAAGVSCFLLRGVCALRAGCFVSKCFLRGWGRRDERLPAAGNVDGAGGLLPCFVVVGLDGSWGGKAAAVLHRAGGGGSGWTARGSRVRGRRLEMLVEGAEPVVVGGWLLCPFLWGVVCRAVDEGSAGGRRQRSGRGPGSVGNPVC